MSKRCAPDKTPGIMARQEHLAQPNTQDLCGGMLLLRACQSGRLMAPCQDKHQVRRSRALHRHPQGHKGSKQYFQVGKEAATKAMGCRKAHACTSLSKHQSSKVILSSEQRGRCKGNGAGEAHACVSWPKPQSSKVILSSGQRCRCKGSGAGEACPCRSPRAAK